MSQISHLNLLGASPSEMLLHGPSKRYLNEYHWHDPKIGIVASYTPDAKDVLDHFGIFRGVDQIEAFAQATIVSCCTFLECQKNNWTPLELKEKFLPVFISIGQVSFHSYLAEGDTFISIGNIKFYKFRQMVADGRIYKVPKELNLNEYFSNFTANRLKAYDLDERFVLIAELFDVTGRALKRELIENK
ncbi:MAG: hypothetical protein JWQ25_907 [Daejeonella sp.]|nr:hypothetical protein [Daejeonella sp.]